MECAAMAGRALHPHSPAVLLNDTSRDVQAEAHTGKAAIINVAGAMKSLEHERLILDRDTYSLIVDTDSCVITLVPYLYAYWRRWRTVFERVLNKIGNDLFEARCVDESGH